MQDEDIINGTFIITNSLSIRHATRAVVSGSALAALALLCQPALAQLKSQDIVGVALGMTPDQAEAALRAHEPKFRFQKIYWRGLDDQPGKTVGKLLAALPGDGYDVGKDLRGVHWKRPDSLAVYFTQGTGRVFAIYRQVYTGQVGVSGPQMKEALTNKYGPSLDSESPGLFSRSKVLAKQAENCSNTSFDWAVQPQGYMAGCGQSFNLRFQDAIANQVFQSYRVWLLDHEAAAADAIEMQALRQAQVEALNRKAQESAKSNKQAL